MKTILFPTDFSDNANHALRLALKIASKNNSQLILFNAFWVPVYEFDTPPEIKSKERLYVKDAMKELKKTQERISAEYPQIETEILVSNGFTADAIVKAGEEKKADMIVMGTKGATGLKEIIMGSNTVDVINKSKLPVLVVPDKVEEYRFARFVFATDFLDGDRESMAFLIQLATLFDAEITIVHVTEDDFILETADKAILQKFKAEIKKESQLEKIKYKLLKGDVVEELEGYLKENSIDLLSMVTTKRHFLSRIFERSITQKMAFHTNVPLLVLHNQKH